MPPKSPSELALRLGYVFRDLRILELACYHKSYGNEHRSTERVDTRDNERLEFLGDAVLDLVISQLLLQSYPDCSEGDLSRLRAGLVNEKSLARVARGLDLGDYIWLGKGETHTGGKDKDSILASTLEAVVAAVYVDGGYDAADAWVRQLFAERLSSAETREGLQDYKTRLQEIVQARFKSAPKYELVSSSGPDHAKTFEIQLIIAGQIRSTGSGRSKKEAEQSAAQTALDLLERERTGAESK